MIDSYPEIDEYNINTIGLSLLTVIGYIFEEVGS
jgi:hypothetical protein